MAGYRGHNQGVGTDPEATEEKDLKIAIYTESSGNVGVTKNKMKCKISPRWNSKTQFTNSRLTPQRKRSRNREHEDMQQRQGKKEKLP